MRYRHLPFRESRCQRCFHSARALSAFRYCVGLPRIGSHLAIFSIQGEYRQRPRGSCLVLPRRVAAAVFMGDGFLGQRASEFGCDVAGKMLDDALSLLRRDDYQGCARLCRRVIDEADRASPLLPEALSLLGLALLPDQPDLAKEYLAKAVDYDPSEPQFRLNLARGWMRLQVPTEAEKEFRSAVNHSGRHFVTLMVWARFLVDMNRPVEAEAVLREVLASRPGHKTALRMLAQALFDSGEGFAAREALERAVGESPRDSNDALLLARIARQLHDFAGARRILDSILATEPPHPEAVALANLLSVWSGDGGQEEELLDRALKAHPTHSELVALKLQSGNVSEAELNAFRALARNESEANRSRARILFALAQYHDAVGEFDRAWEFAVEANALVRADRAPDPPDALRARREKFLGRARALAWAIPPIETDRGHKLIYLCGAPRTGGSLVQSVLSAAAGAKSVGERAALLPPLFRMIEEGLPPEPEAVAALQAADLNGLARLDVRATMFIDKAPHNILAAGLIAAVHSQARFLATFREPADTMISILMRGFPPAFEYSYGPDTICDYLLFQAEAVSSWIEDGIDLRLLDHDEFVRDPLTLGPHLASWAGVDWSPEFLDPAKRIQPVATFSARQVRKPIGPSATARRKTYREQLRPFESKLEKVREAQAQLLESFTIKAGY